jgi:hypothetical protein
MQIKYIKMPISIEQKKEFNKQGFKVVDAKFDPSPVAPKEEERKAIIANPKRKTRAKKA